MWQQAWGWWSVRISMLYFGHIVKQMACMISQSGIRNRGSSWSYIVGTGESMGRACTWAAADWSWLMLSWASLRMLETWPSAASFICDHTRMLQPCFEKKCRMGRQSSALPRIHKSATTICSTECWFEDMNVDIRNAIIRFSKGALQQTVLHHLSC